MCALCVCCVCVCVCVRECVLVCTLGGTRTREAFGSARVLCRFAFARHSKPLYHARSILPPAFIGPAAGGPNRVNEQFRSLHSTPTSPIHFTMERSRSHRVLYQPRDIFTKEKILQLATHVTGPLTLDSHWQIRSMEFRHKTTRGLHPLCHFGCNVASNSFY